MDGCRYGVMVSQWLAKPSNRNVVKVRILLSALTKCERGIIMARDLIKEHLQVCDLLNTIYQQKNKAYGNSFGDTYKDLGIISAVTRISDKFNRLKTLAKDSSIPNGDESIADTLLDMSNYCIMTYMELNNKE